MRVFLAFVLASFIVSVLGNPCSSQPRLYGPLPDETDCQYYWYCQYGFGKRHNCDSGYLYNHEVKLCDWHENFVCPYESVPTPSTPPTTPGGEETTVITTTCGGFWNPCRTTSEGSETTTPTPVDPTTAPPPSDTCPPKGIAKLPIAGDCSRYIVCVDGEEFIEECGNETEFDDQMRICRMSRDVSCNACPLEDPPRTLVYVPNREDCNKYFLCRKREQIPMECDPKLHFNQETSKCLTPAEAKCKYQYWE